MKATPSGARPKLPYRLEDEIEEGCEEQRASHQSYLLEVAESSLGSSDD